MEKTKAGALNSLPASPCKNQAFIREIDLWRRQKILISVAQFVELRTGSNQAIKLPFLGEPCVSDPKQSRINLPRWPMAGLQFISAWDRHLRCNVEIPLTEPIAGQMRGTAQRAKPIGPRDHPDSTSANQSQRNSDGGWLLNLLEHSIIAELGVEMRRPSRFDADIEALELRFSPAPRRVAPLQAFDDIGERNPDLIPLC